jgi:hypothetical protein
MMVGNFFVFGACVWLYPTLAGGAQHGAGVEQEPFTARPIHISKDKNDLS